MKSIYRAHSKEAEAEKNSTKNQNEEQQEGGEKKVFMVDSFKCTASCAGDLA